MRTGLLLCFALVVVCGVATASPHPGMHIRTFYTAAANYDMPATFETLRSNGKYFFYHSHIPKAGGRSFFSIFIRTRVPGIVPCHQDIDPALNAVSPCPRRGATFCPSRFASLREDYEEHGRYTSCNFLTFETKNLTSALQNQLNMPDVKAMTMFREPISHFMAQYLHDQRYHRVDTFATYLRGGVGYGSRGCRGIVGNFQICRLGVTSMLEAKALVSSIFFFGILEYWDASVCLLYYQLGRFDRSKCANLCTDGRTPVIDVHVGTTENKEMVSAKLDMSLVRQAKEINKVDAELYAWATQVFFARVRRVEQRENVVLLCDSKVYAASRDSADVKH
mmetsp:Transcript_30624/g.76651  ORF Transcript_30624/g.76651 Transcript_30624/m.76651 type:complete len:336 (+) Transcript_30624:262-1269(+)